MDDNARSQPQAHAAIVADGLQKSFRSRTGTVDAVRGVDLAVEAGTIFGLLGPNGAGKTTTLRMLTTLLPIDGGRAEVAGVDVARAPREVRRRIGYVGQAGGADLGATGRENLLLQARLHGLAASDIHDRVTELVDLFELAELIDRPARTYSGGQRRRLEIALGLIHRPSVLFLDEPTAGLDPQTRASLWDHVRALRSGGTTIVVVTHYLDEADQLCDTIAIVDRGTVVTEGRPHELKAALARDTVIVQPRLGPEEVAELRDHLARAVPSTTAVVDGDVVRLAVDDGTATLPAVVEFLRREHVPIDGISLAGASLDDVFLAHTGRSLRDPDPTGSARR
ncbi:MAG: ATP-binding cassette domain-containing protein [Chloroflexi bacterium]|nr:ATP-binding cassette domain-containing protein [Chloroflexota bacterium]PWB43416.1 MAG: ABC transporter [Dehalococcoidia bacterium]